MDKLVSLPQLGWSSYFQQQLSLEEWESGCVARLIACEKSVFTLLTETGRLVVDILPAMPEMTVGDWVLLNNGGKFLRLLERLSLFSRKAAGSKVSRQLIAANIDTIFIVSSLNQNFKLNRIERYLVMANEAGVEPDVVLSKEDQCDSAQEYIQQVKALDVMLAVESVNSLDPVSVSKLHGWCPQGKTVAFLGSSGVGKSTLINTLMNEQLQQTSEIRQDDSKGRHTTTGRTLHLMPAGGLLLDTPGMRELQLVDVESGVEETFSEIYELAQQCKFSDCQHENEPGCAVSQAIESGEIDNRRFLNYQKILREQAYNSESLAEKRARGRDLSRYHKSAQSEARGLKNKK